MKRFIKALIPKRLLPYTRQTYWNIYSKMKSSSLVNNVYDRSTTLEHTVGKNKYGRYCVPLSSSNRLAAQKVLSGEVYEPDTIEFMISHCATGDIVHAGTYFGDFLPALSKSCSPGAKVWAFEPNPENHECAKETIQMNNLSNVELTNAGLGEKRELLTMLTTGEDGVALGGRSRLLNLDRNKLSGGVETVQVVSIDEVIPLDRKVSIIQLDVEGHEKQALSGALKTIQRCLPIIIVEAYSDKFFESKWFSVKLTKLGYTVAQTVHNNTILVCNSSMWT